MSYKNTIIRYIVQVPYQEFYTSYNTQLGEKEAKSYSIHHAAQTNGQIFTEMSDGTFPEFFWKDRKDR